MLLNEKQALSKTRSTRRLKKGDAIKSGLRDDANEFFPSKGDSCPKRVGDDISVDSQILKDAEKLRSIKKQIDKEEKDRRVKMTKQKGTSSLPKTGLKKENNAGDKYSAKKMHKIAKMFDFNKHLPEKSQGTHYRSEVTNIIDKTYTVLVSVDSLVSTLITQMDQKQTAVSNKSREKKLDYILLNEKKISNSFVSNTSKQENLSNSRNNLKMVKKSQYPESSKTSTLSFNLQKLREGDLSSKMKSLNLN